MQSMRGFIRWSWFFVLGAAFIASAALSASTAAAQGAVAERLLLTFIPNVQFAPFYVGIEAGHFAAQGFDVSLEHLQEPEVVDLVAAGQANFGIVSGEQVILARAQGRDVVYVYEWFQQYPIGIAAAEAALSDVDDLRGMKVGIPGRFGASYSGLTTLLQSAGLTEADIQLDEIGFNAPDVFCLGAVDAAVVYVNNEPLQMQSRALAGECGAVRAVTVLPVASQVDLVSNGLIVSRRLLEEDPAAVQAMVSGLDGALRATINNPAQAYLVSLGFVDNLPGDADLRAALEEMAAQQEQLLASGPSRAQLAESRAAMHAALAAEYGHEALTQFAVLLATVDLWDAEMLGYSDLESWQQMSDTLRLMGMLDGEAELAAAFTNQFVLGAGG